MQNRSKSIAVSNKALQAKAIIMLSMGVLIAALMIFASTQANAQDKVKPKLIPIILDEKTNDPKAEKIVRLLYKQFIKENDLEGILIHGDIYAQFVPLQQKGSRDRFIVAKVLDPPLGCFAKGCQIDVYRSTDGKNWKPAWGGFLHNIWYDDNSRDKTPANLVMSSDLTNKNIGVWIWSVSHYFLANKRK